MNISYETSATLYGIAAIASWLVFMACGLSVFATVQKAAISWMRRTGKPYSCEAWFNRCILVYCFLTIFLASGFSLLAKIMAWFVLIHLATDNPWMIRRVERTRTEAKMKGKSQ